MPHRTSLCIGGHLDGRHDRRLAFPGPGPSVLMEKIKSGTVRRTLAFALPYAGLLAVFLLVVLVDGALGIAQIFLSSKIGAEIVLSLRNRLFQHIQRMPLAFFTRTQTGALVSRLNTDVSGTRTFWS